MISGTGHLKAWVLPALHHSLVIISFHFVLCQAGSNHKYQVGSLTRKYRFPILMAMLNTPVVGLVEVKTNLAIVNYAINPPPFITLILKRSAEKVKEGRKGFPGSPQPHQMEILA